MELPWQMTGGMTEAVMVRFPGVVVPIVFWLAISTGEQPPFVAITL
jgi:hypothetical protein